MRRRALAAATIGLALARGQVAHGYPTSLVFLPTAETLPLGTVSGFVYGSTNLHPRLSSNSGWLGVEAGVVASWKYGVGELRFGGLELGVDAANPDFVDTPSSYVTLVNAKAQLLAETSWLPSLALGAIVAPFDDRKSPNVAYGVLSKTVKVDGRSFGSVTVGLADYATPYSDVFASSWPFSAQSRLGLLAGYRSPDFGPVAIAGEYVGGLGILNSTNVAALVTPWPVVTVSLGAFFSNSGVNAAEASQGLFANVALTTSLLRLAAR